MVTCGNDGDVRIWESLDDDDPKFITVGEKAYSLALKVRFPLTLLQISCTAPRIRTFCSKSMCDCSTEWQAGNGKLQQHRADPHVSRRRPGWHPDPLHNQRHARRLQQQRLESRSRIQVLETVGFLLLSCAISAVS